MIATSFAQSNRAREWRTQDLEHFYYCRMCRAGEWGVITLTLRRQFCSKINFAICSAWWSNESAVEYSATGLVGVIGRSGTGGV